MKTDHIIRLGRRSPLRRGYVVDEHRIAIHANPIKTKLSAAIWWEKLSWHWTWTGPAAGSVSPGIVNIHGDATTYETAVTAVVLTGTPCYVYVERLAFASTVTIQTASTFPKTAGGIFRKTLYKFSSSDGNYTMDRDYRIDVDMGAPKQTQ